MLMPGATSSVTSVLTGPLVIPLTMPANGFRALVFIAFSCRLRHFVAAPKHATACRLRQYAATCRCAGGIAQIAERYIPPYIALSCLRRRFFSGAQDAANPRGSGCSSGIVLDVPGTRCDDHRIRRSEPQRGAG